MALFRYEYQDFLDAKMALIAEMPSVFDIGSSEPFSKWLEPYKPLFAEVVYQSFDNDPTTGATVVGDIHSIPLPDNSVDAIICSSVLEHVRDPLRAMEEMRRILKPGGRMIFFVPSIYPYHTGKNGYPDYWRFFGDTIKILFTGFTQVDIQKRGGYFLALSYFVPKQHKIRAFLDKLAWVLDTLFRTERRNTTAGFYAYAVK
jgi:SAM-dependent methyltransferase